jgi:hypothetical protein
MELFTAIEKLKKFFWQLEMFDTCTTGDKAHIDTIFKFLPYTCKHGCIDILHSYNNPCQKQELEYCNGVCSVIRVAHRTSLVVNKKILSFPVAVKNSIKVGLLIFLL